MPANKLIKVRFSESIRSGSSYKSITVKSSSGKIIPITKWTSHNILYINHSAGTFIKGNKYILTLPKYSISDLSYNKRTIAFSTSFTIDKTPPKVTASPVGNYYNISKAISLKINEPGIIYYTKNGATPTRSSTKYTSPILVTTTTTLKFFAIDLSNNYSPIYSQKYTIDKTRPTASATPTGSYSNISKSVTLKMSEPGTIYYTTNGATPTVSSTKYTIPIVITTTTTLKFIAKDLASNLSPLYTQKYTIDKTSPTASASIPGGYYNTDKTITLSMDEPGNIYYTINGDIPTTSSNKYSGPIAVATNTVLKYMAVDLANNHSPVYTHTYIIDTIPPTANANPIGGTFDNTQSVVLEMSEPGNIYYTFDGTPTTSSTKYKNPIIISSVNSLILFCRRFSW